MSLRPRAPIIIIRKQAGDHDDEGHGGAWKVAYADFVTAMMALFIVLWLLSASEKVQKAVGGYFLDPTGKGRQTGTTNSGVGETLTLESRGAPDILKRKLEQVMKQIPSLPAYGEADQNHADHRRSANRSDRNGTRSVL